MACPLYPLSVSHNMPVWAMVFLFFMWFMVDSASKWYLRLQTRFFCRKKIQQT